MTPTITKMKLGDLKVPEGGNSIRGFVDLDHVRTLAEMYRAGAKIPLIQVTKDGRVVAGHHRVLARKQAILNERKMTAADADAVVAQTEIDVEVVEGSERELFEIALAENLQHGLPVPLSRRHELFTRVFLMHYASTKTTQERLAEIFGVQRQTIGRWIEQINGERLVRPPTTLRPSQEIPRSVQLVPIGPRSALGISATAPWSRPKEETLTERTFRLLQEMATYARDDEVTEESIAELAMSLADTHKSLFLTSVREGLVKVIHGLELVYERLKRRPPWERESSMRQAR